MVYKYNDNDFIYETSWLLFKNIESQSNFDNLLQTTWNSALNNGCFRYSLNILHSETLPGRYSFVKQLNTDRATNRRTPQDIATLTQPFNSKIFNFTKIKDEEKLFELRDLGLQDEFDECKKNYLVINASPLEFGHCLLLPALNNCLPQVITVRSLILALHVILLSSTPSLRVGFNSLCGFASVNHLHYHVYYLEHQMLLESIKVDPLSGPCYEIADYPAPGFAFQLSVDHRIESLAQSVYRVANYLQVNNIAHNLYITRGSRFEEEPPTPTRNTVRVYIWARKSSSGAKESAAFNPALCELSGHLSIKSESAYRSITEAQVSAVLENICWEPFTAVREDVRRLFCEGSVEQPVKVGRALPPSHIETKAQQSSQL